MNINVLYQIQRELPARLSPDCRRHSQLAMQAAKSMAATRQKARHGRVVCHHLLRMLSCEPGRNQSATPDFELTSPVTSSPGEQSGQSEQYGSLAGRGQVAQAEQFSLGF